MTHVEAGGRFIRSGLWLFALGFVMSFGMVGHYIGRRALGHGQSVPREHHALVRLPVDLSTAVVVGGALGMIAIGAVYAIVGKTARRRASRESKDQPYRSVRSH